MLVGTDFERSVSARLLDFFAAETLWQRRLWDVGACSSLRELVEATAAVADGALTQESVNWFKASLSETLGPDVGIGSPEQRRVLQEALKSDLVAGSHEVSIVRQIADSAENTYLSRWASALGSNKATAFRTERVARAVSAHMLSRGFSPQYLHRWWTFHLKHEPGTRGLGDLVADAHNRSTQPLQSFEVIAPLRAASGRAREIPEWLSAKTTSEILSPHTRRPMSGLAGALRFSVEARDTDAAVDIAADRVDRYVARITLGGRNEHLEPMKHAWVSQAGHDFSRTHLRPRRGLEIPVLYRREEPITASVEPQIDASLELLGPVDLGSPSAAVSGAWAAVETLLTGPGDRGKVQAADRLASLIVCSFVRAELTELAHSYMAKGSDVSFVDEIGNAETNTRRAGLMADLLHSSPVTFPDPSEQAAADRMHRILANPHSGLADVENHVKRVIRRLYRVRNLVLHNAATNSTTLTAALRTAVPLLGTGIDRIVRGAVLQECRPLELAARARIVLDTASNLRPAEFADLLGLAD